MAINTLKKLLAALDKPFTEPDSVAYCYCESCGIITEISFDLFDDLLQLESFRRLRYLDDPEMFRRTYYFTIERCFNCPDGQKPQLEGLEGMVSIQFSIKEISDLHRAIEREKFFPKLKRVISQFGFSSN